MKRDSNLKNMKWSNQRGSALVTVCIFGAIISISAAFAYRSTIFQTRMAQRSQDYLTALAVAEAGAELAMVELNKDAAVTPAAFTSWSGTTTKTYKEVVKDNSGATIGESKVTVSNVDTETPTIVATGFIPSEAKASVARTVQLTTLNDTIPSPFGGFGIFAYNNISMNGTTQVWSYSVDDLPGGYESNKRARAALGAIKTIGLTNQVAVHGNAQAGISVSGGQISGERLNNNPPTTPPAIPEPDFSTAIPASNDNSQIELYNNNTKVLNPGKNITTNGTRDIVFPAPGVYVLDSLTLAGAGNMKIQGEGEVTILVSGKVDISGAAGVMLSDGAHLNIAASTVELGKEVKNKGKESDDKILNFSGKGTVNLVADDVVFGRSVVMANNETEMTLLVNESMIFNGSRKFNDDSNAPASNLKIFSKGSNITFNGGANLAAAIYAPNSTLRFNGSSDFLRGVFIVKDWDSNGKQSIYLEEELTQPVGGDGSYVTSWLEKAPVK